MQAADKFTAGVYREADSWLHRFDPRLKLLLLLGVIACVFSAGSPLRLALIFLCWLVAAQSCANGLRESLRVVRLMRWLLLFALFLHLFLTPGRTLFGVRWLSYDGLLRGLLIDGQLLLAIFFSLLLAWTSRPETLAWGLGRLLAPLQKLRVPVREAVGLLLLVLHFFPLIQTEVAVLQKQRQPEKNGLLERIKFVAEMIGPLLFRLVDRADKLAIDIAAGKESFAIDDGSLRTELSRLDLTFFATGLLVLLLLWMV